MIVILMVLFLAALLGNGLFFRKMKQLEQEKRQIETELAQAQQIMRDTVEKTAILMDLSLDDVLTLIHRGQVPSLENIYRLRKMRP